MKFDRRAILGAAAAAFALSLPAVPASAEEIRLAGAIPGSITDQAFNQAVYEGIVLARDTLGIEVAYTEKVKQADQSEVIEDYARRGYNVVFGAGGEYVESTKRAARRFPDTLFMCLNCALIKGVATVNYDNLAIGYLLGYVGGKMSDTKTLGLISGQKIKPALDIVKGMKAGLKAATGGGKVLVTYTQDWDDVAKAKEAALGQISQGATAIVPYLDNGIVGVIQGLEDKGKHALSVLQDLGKTKPDVNLISVVASWQEAILAFTKMAKDGTVERKDYRYSIGSKPLSVGIINPKVASMLQADIDQILADVKAGKLKY